MHLSPKFNVRDNVIFKARFKKNFQQNLFDLFFSCLSHYSFSMRKIREKRNLVLQFLKYQNMIICNY